jgi:hypothetical protein
MSKYRELARRPTDYTGENAFWLRLLSDGGLTEPSALWFSYFRKFDKFFETFHPYGKIGRDFNVVKNLTDFLTRQFPIIPVKAIQL